jgi:hypothetical protein
MSGLTAAMGHHPKTPPQTNPAALTSAPTSGSPASGAATSRAASPSAVNGPDACGQKRRHAVLTPHGNELSPSVTGDHMCDLVTIHPLAPGSGG